MSQIIDRKTNEKTIRQDALSSSTETEIFQSDVNEFPFMFKNENGKWLYSKTRPLAFLSKEALEELHAIGNSISEEDMKIIMGDIIKYGI